MTIKTTIVNNQDEALTISRWGYTSGDGSVGMLSATDRVSGSQVHVPLNEAQARALIDALQTALGE